MLICSPDHSLGLGLRCSDLDTKVQNAALAHSESGRLLLVRSVSLRSPTSWRRSTRVEVHVRLHGNEVVLD